MFEHAFVIALAIILAFFGIFLIFVIGSIVVSLGLVLLENWASRIRIRKSVKTADQPFDEWYEDQLREKGIWDSRDKTYSKNESIRKMKDFVDNRK